MNNNGVIYILTNPSFPDYVKIGYADDMKTRLKQLNRSECTPFAFRVYATYEVDTRLTDMKLHSIIDKLNPNLRAIDNVDGKKRIREFYAMTAEDAYSLFEAMAEIHGTMDKLKLAKPTKKEVNEEKIANEVKEESIERRTPFSFYACEIKAGEIIKYKNDPSIICTVVGDRTINYNGETTSVSALAQKLLGFNHPVQGTLHFTYNREILADLRARLETEGKYGKFN